MPGLYGYDVDAETAIATVEQAIQEPAITFLDTSNNYGRGESERRIGEAIRRVGGLPKASSSLRRPTPLPVTEFTGARVLEAFAESLGRLGLVRDPVFYLHDPEVFDFDDLVARIGRKAGEGGGGQAPADRPLS
jgi:D-threo-aldose 1-dehydrogenase